MARARRVHGGPGRLGVVVLGGPLSDEHRVVLAVEAESEEAVLATLAPDPWHDSHLAITSVEPWTIRLDGRSPRPGRP